MGKVTELKEYVTGISKTSYGSPGLIHIDNFITKVRLLGQYHKVKINTDLSQFKSALVDNLDVPPTPITTKVGNWRNVLKKSMGESLDTFKKAYFNACSDFICNLLKARPDIDAKSIINIIATLDADNR